jgi:hypothetical protein
MLYCVDVIFGFIIREVYKFDKVLGEGGEKIFGPNEKKLTKGRQKT